MMKTCSFCGNRKIKKRRVQYVYRHDGKFLVIDNVPCEECEYCGERYFEAKVLKQIEIEFEKIYCRGKKAKREVMVPVEKFAEIL